MMSLFDANAWVTLVVQLVGLIVVSIGAIWAYTRYALERGLLAPTQFTIEATVVGSSSGATLLEVLLHLRNVGSSCLVAKNIRVDIRYLNDDDGLTNFNNPSDVRFGRVNFKHSLLAELAEGFESAKHPIDSTVRIERSGEIHKRVITEGGRGFVLVDRDTFVQPGVNQTYTFATSLPDTCVYALIWASFEYAQRPYPLQKLVLKLSRRLGLIQYSLQHVTSPHTVERAFKLTASS